MRLSVIICTHNPDQGRLRSTLLALRAQSLPSNQWETIIVNNASSRFADDSFFDECAPPNLQIVSEQNIGLTSARHCGFNEAKGEIVVMVDDDNVLAPDYLAIVVTLLSKHTRIGALGGKCIPKFEVPPPVWAGEFYGLLALRDLGETPLISNGLRPHNATHNEYPLFAPMGAGMALRREAGAAWINLCQTRSTLPSDRRGTELTSSGDNDIVLALMRAGWEVGYFPELSLTHLIPAARLTPNYLARLNYGIQQSWQQVLILHDASPWPRLTRLSAILRKAKAWVVCKPWTSSAARIRWHGTCGHLDGRIGK